MHLTLTFRALNQTGEFDITATNGCGTDTKEYVFKSVSCLAAAAPVSNYSIQAGRLVKELEYMNMPQQVQVNTAGIYPGVYIVELFNGISTSRKKIIIKR